MRSCLLALTWLGAVVLLALQRGSARAAPGPGNSATRAITAPRLTRGLLMQDGPGAGTSLGARYARNRGQARPMEGLVLLDELEAAVDEDKRQFDDYGHMRFGKRGPQQQAAAFDDYGHMRFGRAGSD